MGTTLRRANKGEWSLGFCDIPESHDQSSRYQSEPQVIREKANVLDFVDGTQAYILVHTDSSSSLLFLNIGTPIDN